MRWWMLALSMSISDGEAGAGFAQGVDRGRGGEIIADVGAGDVAGEMRPDVPAIVSVQPSAVDLAVPFTVKALSPVLLILRCSTVVSMGRESVLVMPAPRQTISSSNMNQDFFPVRVTPTPLNCMPAAPKRPSVAPPTQCDA